MFRLLHSADWHLGQTLHGFDRTREHTAAIEAMLSIMEQQQVDAAIIAGDLYHVANPPVQAQKIFFEFIRALADRAPQVDLVVIAGNHDSGPRLELPQILGVSDRIRIVGAPPRTVEGPDPSSAVLPLRDATGAPRAAAIALPYPRPGDLFGVDKDGHKNRGEVGAFLDRAAAAARRAYPELPMIVASHLHVRGGAATEASERPILIGGEDAIALTEFPQDAAYIALGHLHRPQTLCRAPLTAYAGAPIPLSADEAGYEQSVCLVDLPDDREGAVALRRLVLPRSRAFLRAPRVGAAPLDAVEEMLTKIADDLRQDRAAADAPPFLEVAVQLDGPEPDLRRRIEAALGDAPARLIRIRQYASGAAGEEEQESSPSRASPSPEAAFDALYDLRYGEQPPAALKTAFRALLETAQNGPSVDAPPSAEPTRRSGAAHDEGAEAPQ